MREIKFDGNRLRGFALAGLISPFFYGIYGSGRQQCVPNHNFDVPNATVRSDGDIQLDGSFDSHLGGDRRINRRHSSDGFSSVRVQQGCSQQAEGDDGEQQYVFLDHYNFPISDFGHEYFVTDLVSGIIGSARDPFRG